MAKSGCTILDAAVKQAPSKEVSTVMHHLALFLFIQHGMLLLLSQGTQRVTLSLLRLLFHSAAPQAGPAGTGALASSSFKVQVLDFAFAEFHTIPIEAASEVLLDASTAAQCMGCSS